MPFHPDGADLPLSNPAAGATPRAKSRATERSAKIHLAEAIGGEEIVGTSQMFAENGSDRAFVIAGCRHAHSRKLESRIVGVAQIAVEIPRPSERAFKPEPAEVNFSYVATTDEWPHL